MSPDGGPAAAPGNGRGRHSGGGHARGGRDWRQITAAALTGTAAGLEVNAASNYIGDWAALVLTVVGVLFAAAWLREQEATSRLRTTAAGTAVTLSGLALVLAGFSPAPIRFPALLSAVLLTTLAALLPDQPLRAITTLASAASLGLGVASLGEGAAFLLGHEPLAGAACLGCGVSAVGLGGALLLHHDGLFGAAILGLGVSAAGLGGAALLLPHGTLLGAAAIGAGVAMLGFGAANLLGRPVLASAAALGLGVSSLGPGAALLLHHDTLTGAAFLGLAVTALGGGGVVLTTSAPVRQRWRAWVTEWTRARP